MGLDSLSPVAPARVRCLIVPCGQILRTEFLRHKHTLEQNSTVRLGDVSPIDEPRNSEPDPSSAKGIPKRADGLPDQFSPQAFPSGRVFYDFTVSDVLPSHLSLAPFELFRRPLVILGIASGALLGPVTVTEASSAKESLQSLDGPRAITAPATDDLLNDLVWLRDHYASAVTHKVFVFDCPESAHSPSEDLILVPPPERLKTTTMKTIMCDLAASLMTGLASLARSVQTQSSIETPSYRPEELDEWRDRPGSRGNDFSRPASRLSETPSSRSVSPAPFGERGSYRASLPAHLASSLPQSPREDGNSHAPSRESSRGPPVTFDEINGQHERPVSRSSLDMSRLSTRAEMSAPQPLGPSSLSERAKSRANGRVGVVLGSMYLLAGRWPDALRELTNSAFLARGSNDHVWHAKALEYIIVCLLLYGWAGLDFTVCLSCPP